ncbi:MAG TPA: sirohydrochlorin chelatase [Egibacteraceae bacterium]|nr:sirohydrochlorin chelatase [Egibacteraceae bacterium]
MITPAPGLLLVGHGTRSQAGVAEYLALAERVRSLAGHLDVAAGFIELSPPPISVAVGDLVAAGHTEIVVVPLVLFDAGHAKTDVPASVNLARADHPGVRFTYGRALGVHPDLLAAVEARLHACVPAGERARTGVLLVGRGSSDPDANAELHRVARLLWEGRDWPLVEAAFVGITAPRVAEGLDRLVRLGAPRVAVVPYFLFTGVLEERIRAQAGAFAAAHAGVDVAVTRYLGPDDAVAALVLERYAEVVAGGVPRSCDTCVHRVPTPGFGHKLGSPLVPHHHPDDARTHRPTHAHG